jgi:hypothetical protein
MVFNDRAPAPPLARPLAFGYIALVGRAVSGR